MAGRAEQICPGIYRIDAIRFANAINVLAVSGEDGWTLVDIGQEDYGIVVLREGGRDRLRQIVAASRDR